MNPLDKAAKDAAEAMAPAFERRVASLIAAAESMRAVRTPAVPSMLNISGFGAPAAQDEQVALIEQLTKLNDKLLAENGALKDQLASTRVIQPAAQFATATAFDMDPLLTEARKLTTLLEVIAKHADGANDANAVALRASDPADPFAPVFHCEMKGGEMIAKVTLRPGSCVYLVSATGPKSLAIKYSADGPRHVLVAPLVEIPL